jgi:uncharacterized membrane protein
MKKTLVITVSLIMISFIVMMIAMPSRADSTRETSNTAMTTSIPDSVNTILEKSCYPCHSAPGKSMAMSKVNFDKWETYKPEKRADKAEDICKEVTKGGMPPKSFRSNNPEKVPTQAELQIICNWAASMESKDEK